jgi:transcriptional regulator of arginine metabolism
MDKIVRDIIVQEKPATQGEIVRRVRELGHAITQPTVSRILNKIGAMKTTGPDGSVYYRIVKQASRPEMRISDIGNLILDLEANDSVLLVYTRTGSASHVAQLIDEAGLPHVMGTIAGDNTILVVPDHSDHIEKMTDGLLRVTRE